MGSPLFRWRWPVFLRITKVDEEKRIVYGVAADETPDRQNEIWDYAGNKPLWEKWSASAAKSTEAAGQEVSYGNIRSMHPVTKQMVVTGKVAEPPDFDDVAKSMTIAAYVHDDGEWEKAKKGLYTGFSIGGRYVKKWADAALKGIQRVIIDPTEISLVDLPANPGAQFTALKADGSEKQRAFKVEARADVSPKEGKEEYGDVEFADAKNKKYPIDTVEHIRAAWNYINKAKNQAKYSAEDVKSIKAKIVAAWKKKIDKEGPPSAQKAFVANAAKGLWTVQSLGGILQTLAYMVEEVTFEREREGDDSDIPERLAKAVGELSDIFLEMAEEETQELIEGLSLPTGTEGE